MKKEQTKPYRNLGRKPQRFVNLITLIVCIARYPLKRFMLSLNVSRMRNL